MWVRQHGDSLRMQGSNFRMFYPYTEKYKLFLLRGPAFLATIWASITKIRLFLPFSSKGEHTMSAQVQQVHRGLRHHHIKHTF